MKKKYDRVYHKLTVRPLYGMEESARLQELRKNAEKACYECNKLMNRTDALMDKERELKKIGIEDGELSLMIDEALDNEAEARSALESLERKHREVWYKEIFSKMK